MPLFGGKHKTPQELVKIIRESIQVLGKSEEKDEKKTAKCLEDLGKALDAVRQLLCGSTDHEPNAETTAQIAQEFCTSQLLQLIIDNLAVVEFEGRKDFVLVFNNLLRRQHGTRLPTVDHVAQHPLILSSLVKGYENQEIALSCGAMLRECLRSEELAALVAKSDDLFRFFEYVEVSTFDISSDAFLTFKELLTRHKQLTADLLEAEYERFFLCYQNLLNSDNYVTRRQALRLLGDLLMERRNGAVMSRYVGQTDNLKLMMNLMKDESKNIQFEAFHVFKVFVANPEKPRSVQETLLRNQEKLVEFLTKFHDDRLEDEQFNDEKTYLIKQIRELKVLDPPATAEAPIGREGRDVEVGGLGREEGMGNGAVGGVEKASTAANAKAAANASAVAADTDLKQLELSANSKPAAVAAGVKSTAVADSKAKEINKHSTATSGQPEILIGSQGVQKAEPKRVEKST